MPTVSISNFHAFQCMQSFSGLRRLTLFLNGNDLINRFGLQHLPEVCRGLGNGWCLGLGVFQRGVTLEVLSPPPFCVCVLFFCLVGWVP